MHRLMVESPFLLIRAAARDVRARLGSHHQHLERHGLRASAFKSAYVTAKHALEGLSKVTALEGGPHGVTSNCINPAYVRTPLVEKQIADQASVHGIAEDEVVEKIMLTESVIKRLSSRRGRLARRMARERPRRHGDRRQLHDGRRVDGAMSTRVVRGVDVAVPGGSLGSVWDADPGAPTILAVHGVTSSHLAWELLAEALPHVRIIAPDLRGRGRSNGVSRGHGGPRRRSGRRLRGVARRARPRGGALHGRVRVGRVRARHPELVARLSSSTGDCRWRRRRVCAGRARRGDPRPTAARLSRRFADVDDYRLLARAPRVRGRLVAGARALPRVRPRTRARRLVPTGDELRDDRRGHGRHEHA
jgi:hypothetical protein